MGWPHIVVHGGHGIDSTTDRGSIPESRIKAVRHRKAIYDVHLLKPVPMALAVLFDGVPMRSAMCSPSAIVA